MRCIASAVSILVLLPAALRGQPAASDARVGSAGGLRVGSPATVSVALGLLREVSRLGDNGRAQAVFALVEPGLKAGRLSLGFGDAYGNLGTGWTIRASALRVWRGTIGNYVGGEVSGMVLGLGPRVGLFQRVGAGDGSTTRVTFDFGFGL